ncbi:unnamed protein product [Closterium sp. Yama58-4]|nr:unnamed protein product [Closterium sp. Yama58-4]
MKRITCTMGRAANGSSAAMAALMTSQATTAIACRFSLHQGRPLPFRRSLALLSSPRRVALTTRCGSSSSSSSSSADSSGKGADPKQLFAVIYEYVPDIVTRREKYREEHVQLCRSLAAEGKMVAGAATGNPPTGALLIVRANNREEVIRDLIDTDPYVTEGLVVRHLVEPWTPVVGTMAEPLQNVC